MHKHKTHHKKITLNNMTLHYREAGAPSAPTILLLHGFPTSSHMFRNLIPLLADSYHIIAPDYPGFGLSDTPDHTKFSYTFESIADVLDQFITAKNLTRFSLYIFDYGAPVGLRLALKHPEKVQAMISQNGNAYEEGLSDGWGPVRTYWQEPTQKNRDALRAVLSPESTKFQYFQGVTDPSLIAPEGYLLDQFFIERPGNDEIQLDLLGDYKTNVTLYPTFQQYFRKSQVPLLAIWGKNDPYFVPAGAEAFTRDLPQAIVTLLDTGHFALETHCHEIAQATRQFLQDKLT